MYLVRSWCESDKPSLPPSLPPSLSPSFSLDLVLHWTLSKNTFFILRSDAISLRDLELTRAINQHYFSQRKHFDIPPFGVKKKKREPIEINPARRQSSFYKRLHNADSLSALASERICLSYVRTFHKLPSALVRTTERRHYFRKTRRARSRRVYFPPLPKSTIRRQLCAKTNRYFRIVVFLTWRVDNATRQ